MRERTKQVTWRNLTPGQIVHSWGTSTSQMFSSATVKSANVADVILMEFGTRETRVPAEGTMFEVDMTPEEFRSKWRTGAEAVIAALQVDLSEYEAGDHDMCNGFIDNDPFEMAAELSRMNIKLVGVARGITPHHSMISGDLLDVGLVVVDKDSEDPNDRWWVHYRSQDVQETLNWWNGKPTNYMRPRDFEL